MDPYWHGFWTNKLAGMGRSGIRVYRGRVNAFRREKGVDVHLAIDLMRDFMMGRCDIVAIVSQDRDFDGVVSSVKDLSKRLQRPVRVMCAFPMGPGTTNRFGIQGAQARGVQKEEYDACLDPRDYRPAGVGPRSPVAAAPFHGPLVSHVRVGLGLGRDHLGLLLGVPADRVRAWERGKELVPDHVQFWLRPLASDPALLKRYRSECVRWTRPEAPSGPSAAG